MARPPEDVDLRGLRNSYFHSPYFEPDVANSWDITDPAATPVAECDYFRSVFLELERTGAMRGMRVLVTSSVTTVPLRGDDVVVLVLHDEWARTPAFAGDVRAVLKCYGDRPWFPWRSVAHPSVANAVGLANHVRVRAVGASHDLRRRRALPGRWGLAPNVLPVPLGWYKQVEVPWIDFAARPHDAFFIGSTSHNDGVGNPVSRALRRTLGGAKTRSREELLATLEQLHVDHPSWRLRVSVSGSFHDVSTQQADDYSQLMMSSRFCLAPRGTSLETFRFFEALRVGTVPICEPLPPRWFYSGAPAPVVHAWAQLPNVLSGLLADVPRQLALHHACLSWWSSHCSEQAVAERIDRFVSEAGGGT